MENVNLNARIESEVESILKGVKASSVVSQAPMKDTTFMGDKANIVGGLLGAAAAATLELVSPTGTKGSAIAAFATGALITAGANQQLSAMPNNKATAAMTGVVTFIGSKYVGRTVSDYFPGYCYADNNAGE